jgi:transposase
MMMLMALCHLLYNLGQRQLRISLKMQKATVKNQLNKPTESPTLPWIFQSLCLGRVLDLRQLAYVCKGFIF